MKYVHFAVLVFAAVGCANGQGADQPLAGIESASPAVVVKEFNPEFSIKPSPDTIDAAANEAQTGYVRPDSKTRFRRYVNGMFGPAALGKTVLSAGFSTWRNSPEEWGRNWEGFGRRVASGMGKSVIKQTTIYGFDEALKYDSRFYRSTKKDFGSRLGNALISPVIARNENGRRVVGIPRIVGTYTSSIVAAEAWFPSRYDYKDGLRNGSVSLGMNAAFNVFKEFIWKK